MIDNADAIWRELKRQAEIDRPPTETANAYATCDALAFDPADTCNRRAETQPEQQGQGRTDVESAEQN
jgi:hypothetical protein